MDIVAQCLRQKITFIFTVLVKIDIIPTLIEEDNQRWTEKRETDEMRLQYIKGKG